MGRDTDAIVSLTRALTLNPKLIQASDLLGRIQYEQGELDAAIATYERAVVGATFEPRDPALAQRRIQ